MTKKIRWGILGCGRIASKFASDLALSTTGELYACVSQDLDNAKSFAQKYQVHHVYSNYYTFVSCEELDAVYIATPHSHHFEHTMLCLNAGKPVLCEKPLTVNQSLATQLFDLAKSKKCLLMEAMWTAFLPAIQEVKEKVSKGHIGNIRHLKADFGFKSNYDPLGRLFNPDLAGGSLLDIGIYPLFICLYLMGVPQKVIASGHLADTGVDDECTIMLKYKNGATALLYSTISHNTDTICEVFGTEGKIYIPSRFHEQIQYKIKKETGETTTYVRDKTGFGYYHEIEHFNNCIVTGLTESPILPYSLSITMVQIMDDIRKQIGLLYKWDS